ncbi:MAG: winged helix-turn-helix domain-containing protein [Methanomicrobiales archaeon]|nr:winged helix-turn-helix domain-containing protein [Methanomicrobiales archaeon]
MNPVEIYNRTGSEIQSVFRSRLQIQIMLSLGEGNKTLADLRTITGSTSQALLPKIRKLESSRFIEAVEHEYRLTPLGRIVEGKMQSLILSGAAIKRHRDFWTSHHLEGIPLPFLQRLGDLYNAQVIADTNVDLFNVYAHFIQLVTEGSRISILSPVTSAGHFEAIAAKVRAGIPVEIIVSADLANKFLQEPYAESMQEFQKYPNGRLYILESPLKVGLTVTDKGLSLGLYKPDGIAYDTTTDLFSFDPDAIRWAQDLFNYFKERSRRFSA